MLDTVHSDQLARTGLSTAEAQRRLVDIGPNEIKREESKPAWRLVCTLAVFVWALECSWRLFLRTAMDFPWGRV